MAQSIRVTGVLGKVVEPADGASGAILVTISPSPSEPWARVFAEEVARNSIAARIEDRNGAPVIWLLCERGRVQERYDELKIVVESTNALIHAEEDDMGRRTLTSVEAQATESALMDELARLKP
jgi:hypothetical protein